MCSGIEAATVAWHPLGWTPFGFSQFDPDHDYSRGPDFPSAVLAHHYGSNLPGTAWSGNAPPNFGDMTKFEEWPDAAIDLLVGGTPCQDYSVAGLRAGMDGVRGSLTLTYAAIARKYRAAWLVWENVPGVLSSNAGRDFASFLGLLAGRRIEVPAGGWQSAGIVPGYERAYGLAWRVLDAQFVRVDGFGRAVLNDDGVCSLSDILETGDVPQRYFLSAKACAGILRRAGNRGKQLLPQLAHALRVVAGLEQTSIATLA